MLEFALFQKSIFLVLLIILYCAASPPKDANKAAAKSGIRTFMKKIDHKFFEIFQILDMVLIYINPQRIRCIIGYERRKQTVSKTNDELPTPIPTVQISPMSLRPNLSSATEPQWEGKSKQN